jgi:hypothetical protein
MADIDNSFVLEHLKRVQDRLARIEDKFDFSDAEVRNVKTHQAVFMSNKVLQDAATAGLATRLDFIERPLDLRDQT